MLIELFRSSAAVEPYTDWRTGRVYTGPELADEIERGTLVGRAFVAVAGVLLGCGASASGVER